MEEKWALPLGVSLFLIRQGQDPRQRHLGQGVG